MSQSIHLSAEPPCATTHATSSPRPSWVSANRLIGPDEFGCPTLWDAFIRGHLRAGSSAKCLGSRLGLQAAPQISPQPAFKWLSYGDVYSQIADLSEGLVRLGICGPLDDAGSDRHSDETCANSTTGDSSKHGSCLGLSQSRVAIWCPNQPSWTIAEYACYRTSTVVVSIDDRVSPKSASRILSQTKPQAIILPADKFRKLIKVRAAESLLRKRKLIKFAPFSALEGADETLVHNDSFEELFKTKAHFVDPPELNELLLENDELQDRLRDLSMLSDFTGSGSRAHQSSFSSSPGTSNQATKREYLLRDDLIYIVMGANQLPKRAISNAMALGVSFYDFEQVQDQSRNSPSESSNRHAPYLNVELVESNNCRRPKKETWAAIIYSSGTTGPPKPSVITHGNFASNLAALHQLVNSRKLPEMTCADLVQFSYLPLTHIYEKQSQASVLYNGGSIGFSSVHGLRFLEDITILKPTLLTTTPTFLLRQILSNRLNSLTNFESFKNSIESYLLNKAIEEKIKVLKEGHGEKVWLWDKFVLGYLRDRLGGQLKWIVSGTSPLSARATELLISSLSVRITEGYGLTETCSAACVTLLDDSKIFAAGHVGPPLPCCEAKIVDVPPIFTSRDQPFGRGEIYIRGNNVFAGYFVPSTSDKDEALAPAIDAEGWLATGDIGFFDNFGNLHIVDRLTPVQAMLRQQIHHHFNILNLQKIELSLLNSVKEIEQVFVTSTSSTQSKAENQDRLENGAGQVETLISFVVVNVPKFMMWAETQGFVSYASSSEEGGSRRDSETCDDYEAALDGEGDGADSATSWEVLSAPASDMEDLQDGTEIERFGFRSSTNETEQEELVGQLCKVSKVSRAFLARLKHKGKDAGLKNHEVPVAIHLSTKRFTTIPSSSSTTHRRSSVQGPNTKLDESVMTLKLKTEALISHFLRC